MKIIILHETVAEHDAIGNDIQGMYSLLAEKNDCRVYAKNRINRHVKYLTSEELKLACADRNAVLIYHHSFYWEEGYQILKQAKGKIIIRYHNITPEKYFKEYSEEYYRSCEQGRGQTLQLQREFPDAYWIADSRFNAMDLTVVKTERIGICPPFHQIERWGSGMPDEEILRTLLESDAFNLLFVGRIAPNKGYLKLLKILRYYTGIYEDKVRVRLCGKFDGGLEAYNQRVRSYMNRYGLEDKVELIGEINDQTLLSYYLGSDVLLCCSLHEGFCVPVIEAQYFGLPVVALRSSAVPETMGGRQLVLDDDVYRFAAALHMLRTRPEYRRLLRRQGMKNYRERFSMDVIGTRFLAEFQKGCE